MNVCLPDLVSAWCRRCRSKRAVTGDPRVSANGLVRVRGKCPRCGLSLKAITGRAAG